VSVGGQGNCTDSWDQSLILTQVLLKIGGALPNPLFSCGSKMNKKVSFQFTSSYDTAHQRIDAILDTLPSSVRRPLRSFIMQLKD
jgi:hypothetical protein